jgi:hypothetical protein
MRRLTPQDNPFDLNKASDFSDSEIASQWVDLAEAPGGLLSILKPTLRMPMLLLGGKGSGKTHLMRYCSAPVQATRRGGDLARAIEEDGYMGVYIRADAMNTDKFSEGKHMGFFWERLFGTYFELWLATTLIANFTEYVRSSNHEFDEAEFTRSVVALFDIDVSDSFTDLKSLGNYLTKLRKEIDFSINNSHLRRTQSDVEIVFSTGNLIFGIPDLIARHTPSLRDTLIVYLIDEVENFTIEQQKFLNSLIRYRRGNATIKLGARLYGIRTYETLGVGEPIKRDAEYERVELDRLLRERRGDYLTLVNRLVEKRLRSVGLIGGDDITSIDEYFVKLDRDNYWKSVEADLLFDPKKDRPFHVKLERDLINLLNMKSNEARKIIEAISVPQHLFLEKAATFFFRKNWPSTKDDALEVAQLASRQARALIDDDKEEGAKLYQIIGHFGSDILAQLYHDFRRRVPYAGFETMVDLSQGIVRNLLTNLKHIYRRSQFAGEEPFAGGAISIKSQSDGVRDGAAWFWEDAQPASDGLQVRDAVESLAVLFRTVRFSHAPAECDLCTFSVANETLTENSRLTLIVAENWSYLIRLSNGRKNKNRRSVDEKFQLSPMLAPRWEVSEHRRGSIELNPELANAIFDPDHRQILPTLLHRRLERMLTPVGRLKGDLFEI